MAFDNVSGGDRKNYWPALGDPYETEMVENLDAKLDPKQIRVIRTTAGFTELDISDFGGQLMEVVTDRPLQSIAGGDPVDAMFTFGESARRDFTTLNLPWPPGGDPISNGGRENGSIQFIDFSSVGPPLISIEELGFGSGAPMPPEGWVEFAIWEQDSQSNWFKVDSRSMFVQTGGAP